MACVVQNDRITLLMCVEACKQFDIARDAVPSPVSGKTPWNSVVLEKCSVIWIR